jgi:hypothetical protein
LAACVLGPLDRVLEVDRDRLHVLIELSDDSLETTLGPRTDNPYRDDRGSDDRHGDCRGYDRSHVPKPTTPLGLTVFRDAAGG